MSKRFGPIIENLRVYGIWLALAIFTAWTLFQLRATIIYLALRVVENPSLRPSYWTTGTVTSLDRVVVLTFGILWLGAIIFLEGFLRESDRQHVLGSRSFFLFAGLGAVFITSYLVLLLV